MGPKRLRRQEERSQPWIQKIKDKGGGNSQHLYLLLFLYPIIRLLGYGELPLGFGFQFFSEVQLLIDKTLENRKTAWAPVGTSCHGDLFPEAPLWGVTDTPISFHSHDRRRQKSSVPWGSEHFNCRNSWNFPHHSDTCPVFSSSYKLAFLSYLLSVFVLFF